MLLFVAMAFLHLLWAHLKITLYSEFLLFVSCSLPDIKRFPRTLSDNTLSSKLSRGSLLRGKNVLATISFICYGHNEITENGGVLSAFLVRDIGVLGEVF